MTLLELLAEIGMALWPLLILFLMGFVAGWFFRKWRENRLDNWEEVHLDRG